LQKNEVGNIKQLIETMRFVYLIGIPALMILSGCGDPDRVIKKFTPPEDEAIATNYIALLRKKFLNQLKKI